MSYKTILAHVRDDEPSARTLELAMSIANRFDGHVLGVGAEMYDAALLSAPYVDGALLVDLRDQAEGHLARAKARFHRVAAGLGERAEWRSTLDFPETAVAAYASAADLIVATRPAKGPKVLTTIDPAELVIHAGAPLLLRPKAAAPLDARRIVVGWKDTREARRALTDAMPFLIAAEAVHVVAVSETAAQREGLELVAQRLSRHGVRVQTQIVERAMETVAEDLEEVADLHGADLIVLGAYGHARLREWVFGGVTEDLLATSSRYVLFSH